MKSLYNRDGFGSGIFGLATSFEPFNHLKYETAH